MDQSMEALPVELTIDILSRLPVKTIIHCKLVCKMWQNLVSDSSFVNLHLSRSPTGLIIRHKFRHIVTYNVPGILKSVEREHNVDHHRFHYDPFLSLDHNLTPILQKTRMVGSVNGMICLWQYSLTHDNIYICNPITREYMVLPRQQHYREGSAVIVYGFGVSSRTREYKVVRTFPRRNVLPNGDKPSRPSVLEAEVYILGSGHWRNLGSVPYWLNGSFRSESPFMNNHCHWILSDKEDAPEKLFTFDFDKETFQLFPSPPSESVQKKQFRYQSLAVLKGCLCELDICVSELRIWVMKEYGIKKSWHKEVVIEWEIHYHIQCPILEPMSLIIVTLKDSILIAFKGKLWSFHPRNGTIDDTRMFDPFLKGLSYCPSFLKLQNFESEEVRTF